MNIKKIILFFVTVLFVNQLPVFAARVAPAALAAARKKAAPLPAGFYDISDVYSQIRFTFESNYNTVPSVIVMATSDLGPSGSILEMYVVPYVDKFDLFIRVSNKTPNASVSFNYIILG